MTDKKENEIFALISEQYFTIDKNYDALFAACTTEEERNILKNDYATARRNYRKCLNARFEDNNPEIKKMQKDLASLQKKIEADIANAGRAARVLKMISESVKIAGSIVALAVG